MNLRALGTWCCALALTGCAQGLARVPLEPTGPAQTPAGVYVRYFDGVLILPADYVFEGGALPDVVRFQGAQGALRLGSRAELDAGYLAQAKRTLRTRESLCGLEVLAHGRAPTRWLLLNERAYALFYDRDESVARRLIQGYCDTRHEPTP